MARKNIEHLDPESIAWTPVGDGVHERVLSRDEDTKSYTRMVRFDPGTKISRILVHDFFEEFFVIDGAVTDTTLNKTFTRGSYAFRSPGLNHGPFESPNGCLGIERRFYVPEANL